MSAYDASAVKACARDLEQAPWLLGQILHDDHLYRLDADQIVGRARFLKDLARSNDLPALDVTRLRAAYIVARLARLRARAAGLIQVSQIEAFIRNEWARLP